MICRYCLQSNFAGVGPFRPDGNKVRANGSYKWTNTQMGHLLALSVTGFTDISFTQQLFLSTMPTFSCQVVLTAKLWTKR
jgi:hypothetical protein